MKRFLFCLIVIFITSVFFISCEKKPLTLDDQTSMKTLLKASDSELTDLVIKEATEKAKIPADNITVEYILLDKENQAIVVKSKITDK